MKRRYLTTTLSIIMMIASSAWSSADALTFTPPDKNSAPSQATGGASRGRFFTPSKSNSTPRQATGGASRGNLFTPNKGNSAPQQASGGAARGNLFTPDKSNSAPQQASGGASRGNMFTAPQQSTEVASSAGKSLNPATVATDGPEALIALLPESFYGTTMSERPTIMVYIPASNAQEAAFSIKDETGKTHYKMTIPVAASAGIIAVKIPADAPPLVVGKNYQWFFALKIDGQLSPSTPYVDGWIERIQPNPELTTAMHHQDAMKQATALGKNGVWYDCVATLATLHIAQPKNANIIQQWEELLSSISLKEIVKVPLVASTN